MEIDAMKHVLIGLAKIAREQHLEIEHLNLAVTAIRGFLGPDADVTIDRAMRDSLTQSGGYGRLTDERLATIDRIIDQLQKQ